MTEVQVCYCLMCLTLAPLGWCLLLFDVGYSNCGNIADVLHPQAYTNAGNTDKADG